MAYKPIYTREELKAYLSNATQAAFDIETAPNDPYRREEKAAETQDNDAGKFYQPEPPEWTTDRVPMFIDAESSRFAYEVNDEDFLAQPLMYVLEARNKQLFPQGGGFGFGEFDEETMRRPARDPYEILLLNSFKRIYIPDAGADELKYLFEKIAAQSGVKLSPALKFDVIMKEYGERYFNSENDVRLTVSALKELKIFNGCANTPVSYKDFTDYFDSATELRTTASMSLDYRHHSSGHLGKPKRTLRYRLRGLLFHHS